MKGGDRGPCLYIEGRRVPWPVSDMRAKRGKDKAETKPCVRQVEVKQEMWIERVKGAVTLNVKAASDLGPAIRKVLVALAAADPGASALSPASPPRHCFLITLPARFTPIRRSQWLADSMGYEQQPNWISRF